MRKSKLLLPIDSKDKHNLEFMQSHMREIEKKNLEKIVAYYKTALHEAL